MAIKKVFVDEDENELEYFVNDYGKLYIQVGERPDRSNSGYYSGYIQLNRDDLIELLHDLESLIKEME